MKYKLSVSGLIFDILNTILMILLACIVLYPFIYVVSYSFSESGSGTVGLIIMPKGFSLESYKFLFSNSLIAHSIMISVFRTLLGPLLMIIFTSMAAYVITKSRLPGVRLLRLFFVLTLYFSGGLIPFYLVIKSLNLLGTFSVYIIPSIIAVFSMILIKTFIESLPEGLEEAALIDGANEFVLFWRIIFPLCAPVIAVVGLFSAIEHWNSFTDTLFFNTRETDLYTMQYTLYQTMQSAEMLLRLQHMRTGSTTATIYPENLKMAITVLSMVPIMLAYPFVQKHFTKGMLIGSIKG